MIQYIHRYPPYLEKTIINIAFSLQKIICSEYNPVLIMILWEKNSLIYAFAGNYRFQDDRWETAFKGQVTGINMRSFPCLLKEDLPLLRTLTRYSKEIPALEFCFVSKVKSKDIPLTGHGGP
jgi:hypothetical protein